MNYSALYLLVTILALTACDCTVSVEGKVLASSDKKAIVGATVELVGRNLTTTTDKDGYFDIGEHVGFCYDPRVIITAKNYKPFEIEIKNSSDTKSFVRKSDKEFVNYEQPFYPDTNNKSTFMTGTWIDRFSQNFEVDDELIIFYLDTINPKKEIETIQRKIKTNFRGN